MNLHFRYVSKTPTFAQSNFQTKLVGMIEIVDTLLLAQRQSAWKAFFPIDGATGESSGGTGDVGGGLGGGDDQ